jgi:Tol biopolymer transport system component
MCSLVAGLLVHLAVFPAYGGDTRSGKYFGETPPGEEATIFAPGFASTQHHDDMFPVFSPDGREVIFRINGKFDGIMIAVLYITRMNESGVWSTPEPLPFLTSHMNGGASFAPDGSRIYFTTKRPPLGESEAEKRSRLWCADRTKDGWGEARLVDTPINAFHLNGGCFVSSDGTMYASFVGPGQDKHDIYELRELDGNYPEYHALPGEINTPDMEVAPFWNAAQRYLLYTSVEGTTIRIRISFRASDGSWSASQLVEELTEPEAKFVRTSPDGRYLFFVSHKKTPHSNPPATWTIDEFDAPAMEDAADIYWMDAGFLTDQ